MSESSSQIIGRWFWLIALFGLLGAAAGYLVIPRSLPTVASYDSSSILGVSRFISAAGGVSNDELSSANGPLARYTTTIGGVVQSPQFRSRLDDRLAEKGLVISETELADKVKVTSEPEIYRITVRADGATNEEATLLTQTTTDLLIEEAASEERRIRDSMTVANSLRTTDLVTQLNDVYGRRLVLVRQLDPSVIGASPSSLIQQGNSAFTDIMRNLARLTGNPELALLNARAEALEAELQSIASNQQIFDAEVLRAGQPLFIVSGVETVSQTAEALLGMSESVLIGGVGGLILGWVSANTAEGIRRRRRSSGAATEEGESPVPERMHDNKSQNGHALTGDVLSAYRKVMAEPETSFFNISKFPAFQKTLVVHPGHPFKQVAAMETLFSRLMNLPEVSQVKVSRISDDQLNIVLTCSGDPFLAESLKKLDSFPHEVVVEDFDRLEITLVAGVDIYRG